MKAYIKPSLSVYQIKAERVLAAVSETISIQSGSVNPSKSLAAELEFLDDEE